MGRKLRSVLDLPSHSFTDRIESSKTKQKSSHDKRAKSRIICLEMLYMLIVILKNQHGWKKWLWIHQVHTTKLNVSGQVVTWRRHVDQLKNILRLSQSLAQHFGQPILVHILKRKRKKIIDLALSKFGQNYIHLNFLNSFNQMLPNHQLY